jgi:peptidoglycan/xylan/chitin deacetylase (PgdA/CDA1 family)
MSKARALPVLMYHHVSPSPGLVTVSPDCFRSQISALAKAGWRSVGLLEVERFFAGESLPPRSCVITFDDGYLDNAIYAAPILSEFGMKAVVFVVTDWMGDGPIRHETEVHADHRECKRRIAAGDADSVILRWSEAELLAEQGVFEWHSHTASHIRWDQTVVDLAQRKTALSADLLRSRKALAERLGVVSQHLCWPQGYYDQDYIEVACAAGFNYLYTTRPTVNVVGKGMLEIGRFVTKERTGRWLLNRTGLYSRPWLGRMYAAMRT